MTLYKIGTAEGLRACSTCGVVQDSEYSDNDCPVCELRRDVDKQLQWFLQLAESATGLASLTERLIASR